MEIPTPIAVDIVSARVRHRSFLAGVLVACLLVCGFSGCATLRNRRSNRDAVAARELTRLGQSAMDRGRWSEAETRFRHALELSPEDVAARRHYAQALWQLGQRSEAIENLTAAVAKSGGDPTWTVELGRMLLAENQLTAAMACVDESLQVDQRYADAWILRADILRQQGLYEEALNHYHRACSCGANDGRVLSQIASIYERQRRPQRVITTLQRLQDQVGIAEMDTPTLRRLGLALREIGRYDEAVETLTLAAQRSPQDRDLLVELADCQFLAGQLDGARINASAAARLGLPAEQVRTLMARTVTAHQEMAEKHLR